MKKGNKFCFNCVFYDKSSGCDKVIGKYKTPFRIENKYAHSLTENKNNNCKYYNDALQYAYKDVGEIELKGGIKEVIKKKWWQLW